MYASENQQHVGYNNPAYPGGNWMGTLIEYAKNDSLRLCPSAPLQYPPPSSGNGQGYADRAWVRWTENGRTMFYGSYGYNGWCYSDPGVSEAPYAFAKDSALTSPSRTPFFGDAIWVDGWPDPKNTPGQDLYDGTDDSGLGRFAIARHGGKPASAAPRNFTGPISALPGRINMGYADGHAQGTNLKDLWSLTWSKAWPQ
jgi:prepilin-type processing-associated H-X9-DG protein